jgi:hypothetical protein
MNILKSLCSLLIIVFSIQTATAQQGWEAGGWVGASHYLGDLNTNYNLSKPGLALGGILRYNFNERVCVRFGLDYANVSADDKTSENHWQRSRNLNFKSRIFEFSALGEFNFLPLIHGSRRDFFTPYLFGGVSVYNFNPKAGIDNDNDGKYDEWVELQPLGTEGQFQGEEYFTTAMAFVYGGGMKMDINADWSINVFLSARHLFNDYLDDVSTTYPDMGDLRDLRGAMAVQLSDRSGELGYDPLIGQEGRQRGDSKNKDTFGYLGIGLVYYFGSLKCPDKF